MKESTVFPKKVKDSDKNILAVLNQNCRYRANNGFDYLVLAGAYPSQNLWSG